ncbi:hydroxyisourate hydrolase [Nitrospirillum pindoramense]|uniref:5-hydroxyisourate hydrolase n=1 Tax=Nitrospirillum amazonense TaxID=28077 RepID=A0A560HCT5_9PROT|nr:hydroxyisourate hydrolase [Nitrospirillum amazonense]TWB43364.1 5-hydroxyisourate hydrolase [Nitrospirillum amazonense]
MSAGRGEGRLTTHVLDTMAGKPGAGISLALDRLGDDGARTRVAQARTNADGRCDAPLLAGADLTVGRYELTFAVGAYFKACGVALTDPPFLDEVPIRFAIADAGQHYHVPLLISPYAYSTYRGS